MTAERWRLAEGKRGGVMARSQTAQGVRAPAQVERPRPLRIPSAVVNYLRVLKPRETVLLSLIGICAAIVAGNGTPPLGRLALAAVAIVIGSGGANGLTNYLDRHVDARMARTRRRVLPSGLIHPPERALVWASSLVGGALLLAWYLHPYAFLAAATGVAAALIGRKT